MTAKEVKKKAREHVEKEQVNKKIYKLKAELKTIHEKRKIQ